MTPTRRGVMAPFIALATMPLLPRLAAGQPLLEPTPECSDNDRTPRQTEGPFFRPDSLWRKPGWMEPPVGPDVSPELRWYPVVTFLQLLLDMAVGLAVGREPLFGVPS